MSSVPAAIGALVAARESELVSVDLNDPAVYFVNPTPVAATVTATGVTPTLPITNKGTMCLTLAVTAASGTTPSLTMTIQTSPDGTTWRNLQAFTAAPAVTSQRLSITGVDRYVQGSYVVSGTTPSFTFTLSGDAK